jgi:hypothetical protein
MRCHKPPDARMGAVRTDAKRNILFSHMHCFSVAGIPIDGSDTSRVETQYTLSFVSFFYELPKTYDPTLLASPLERNMSSKN